MVQATVSIRDMHADDSAGVVQIIRAHHETDARLAERYYCGYFADNERLRSAREMNCVAESNGTVVGVSGFAPDKYDWPAILWLNWLYVDPACRRQGIGSALMEFTLDRARSLAVRKVYLDTDSDPSYGPAIRLYERFGFKNEGLLLDYYGKGEHYVIMGLEL